MFINIVALTPLQIGIYCKKENKGISVTAI